MCGIWAYLDLINNKINDTDILFNNFMNLKHRGPDFSSFQKFENLFIGFHRLSIISPSFKSNQPFIINNNDKTIVFICNGEIYNFVELIYKYNLSISDKSDCLTIPYLYLDLNEKFIDVLKYQVKGEYAFVLFEFNNEQKLNKILVGRDHIGVRPLYYSYTKEHLFFSSEIKGMTFINDNIKEFNPGNLLEINLENNNVTNFKFNDFNYVYDIKPIINQNEEFYLNKIKTALINSIKRRLIADKPIGFLLSGGVDSSLVASISASILKTPINTYCCGMENGTDLDYANQVAKHINSNHTSVLFTANEALATIKDVIYTTETWDTTTIRASVGQYLVSKYIGTNTNFKVILVGEGPDEICSSYLFNYYAPSKEELHETAIEYVKNIHLYDGKRADRCISKWGLEARIPFLDPEFIEAYWSIPAEWRHPNYKGIEKWWLRKAFEGSNYLPDNILWRKKEAFSDGISGKNNSWYEIIQDHVKNIYIDKNNNSPTLESSYYKNIFINYFKENNINIIPNYWQPKWIVNKSDNYIDPSARTLLIY